MKIAIIACLLVLSSGLYAQTGVSFGTSMIKGFGIDGVNGGAHVGVEIPRDDEVSYFGRLTATPFLYKQSQNPIFLYPRDPNSTLPGISVPMKTGYNYVNIEGGTRYYIGNSFDYGFSAYGGSMFMVTINSVKAKFGEFDSEVYALPDGYEKSGRIMSLNLGLTGGVKNSFAFGVIYFDASLTYALFGAVNNDLANTVAQSRYSNLNFIFNLGFRKDLY